jgi:hypothetical protein
MPVYGQSLKSSERANRIRSTPMTGRNVCDAAASAMGQRTKSRRQGMTGNGPAGRIGWCRLTGPVRLDPGFNAPLK